MLLHNSKANTKTNSASQDVPRVTLTRAPSKGISRRPPPPAPAPLGDVYSGPFATCIGELRVKLNSGIPMDLTKIEESEPTNQPLPSFTLRVAATHGLEAHDFTNLWHEKLLAHLTGTREWAFTEIFTWLDASDAVQLSWLMGGGGVGKSVLTAELLRRAFPRVVAWHFCRHDNPQQSSPAALLRSLAAMLWERLPGYRDALGEVSSELLTSTDPAELFATLFKAPLLKVESPDTPRLIILDALDELPKQGQKPLLAVITTQLSTLPTWLRLFVTSREEPQIKSALAGFKPKELRADEANNRSDVEVCIEYSL